MSLRRSWAVARRRCERKPRKVAAGARVPVGEGIRNGPVDASQAGKKEAA